MIYFVGAGPGDIELLTLKAVRVLEKADAVLYTGSLVPAEILQYCREDAHIEDSRDMDYAEIFSFLEKYSWKLTVRLHTGDPSLYSTIARQIEFLESRGIEYTVIPGVSAAFAAAASLGLEYTLPGISQTLVISRVEGRTPNPERLETILACKNSSKVFYLSIKLIESLVAEALRAGYAPDTPCWVVEKASWREERVYRGTLEDIAPKVSHIGGVALILLGDFLHRKSTQSSYLYGGGES